MFCTTLVVTRTREETLSKREEKAKEETILPKCNVIVHHSSSNKSSFGGKNNHKNENKRDTNDILNLDDSINSPVSLVDYNSVKCDREHSGQEIFITTFFYSSKYKKTYVRCY